MTWFVLDMDDGLLRREPTRRAAVDWCKHMGGPKVIKRHQYGPGAYEYVCGYDEQDHDGGKFIEREDAAAKHGWDVSQAPLYPYDDRPYERAERE